MLLNGGRGVIEPDIGFQLGFAYEQARGPLPSPRFLPSVEQAPEIAPLLEKPARP